MYAPGTIRQCPFRQVVDTVPPSRVQKEEISKLLREHPLGLLVSEVNLVNRISSVLKRDVVVVNVGGEEDLWIPSEALTRREVGDQTRRALRVANVDYGAFLLGNRRAQKARSAGMARFASLGLGCRRRGLGRPVIRR